MSAQSPSPKRCPRSYCPGRFETDDDVRGHIIDHHGRDPTRMRCGKYTIKTSHYKRKHEENCLRCKPRTPVAQTVIPSIENDADSDAASVVGSDTQENEAGQAGRDHKVFVGGSNYGIIYVMVKGCSASPSCGSDSN